jgi:HSP20 family protein
MDREQIEVMIEGDVISIRGNRPDPATCDHRSFHQARIPYGAFAADVFVPFPVDGEEATASYENGFLRISLPRLQPRTIAPNSKPEQSPDASGIDRDRSHA